MWGERVRNRETEEKERGGKSERERDRERKCMYLDRWEQTKRETGWDRLIERYEPTEINRYK